jgi:hypothetical protein
MITSEDNKRSEAHMRLGLWFLAIGNICLSLYFGLQALPILLDPSGEWAARAITFAPFIVALSVVMSVSAVGALVGNRRSRSVLVSCLAVFTILNLVEAYLGFLFWLSRPDRIGVNWFGLSYAFFWIFWFGVNCWYLFGTRTRDLFAKRV